MKKLTTFVPDVIGQPKTLAGVDGGVHVVLAEAIDDYRSSMIGIADEEIERRVEVGKQAVAELVAKCESPIEKLVVPALVFQPYGSNGPWVPAQADRAGEPRFAPVSIGAQVKMNDARFDFLMRVDIGEEVVAIAVECDGREFHNAERDYWRDAKWLRAGIHTVRLTGSQIYADPRMAASRVSQFVLQKMIERGLA